jgi:hypothetical protein
MYTTSYKSVLFHLNAEDKLHSDEHNTVKLSHTYIGKMNSSHYPIFLLNLSFKKASILYLINIFCHLHSWACGCMPVIPALKQEDSKFKASLD